MKKVLSLLGFALVVGGLACAGVDASTDDSANDEEAAVGEDELRTGGIKSIVVGRSTGFMPPPPAGQCRPSGSWAYDFATKKLSGNACIASTPTTVKVNKTLSDADAVRVRAAVSKVRVTKRPPACPTDMPVSRLEVTRATSQTSYVDARAACGGASTPVTESSLGALVTLMQELSAPVPNGSPCVKTGCSGHICADEHHVTTCRWKPEYACYQSAICERDVDGQCGFRQTPDLAACLSNNN